MTDRHQKKVLDRERRHRRVRAKVSGTPERPRLAVFRSTAHISVQVIDDVSGRTLAASGDLQMDAKERAKIAGGEGERKGKTALAYAVGLDIAEKSKRAGIASVVFDRGGFAYAGRIAALAQGARDGGLDF